MRPSPEKKALGAAPGGVDLDVGGGGEEGAGLDEDGVAGHLDGLDVAGQAGGDGDFAGLFGGEGVDEEALAAEHGSLEAAEQAAADGGVDGDAGGHGDHGAGLGLELFAGGEFDASEGVGGSVEDFVLHCWWSFLWSGCWNHCRRAGWGWRLSRRLRRMGTLLVAALGHVSVGALARWCWAPRSGPRVAGCTSEGGIGVGEGVSRRLRRRFWVRGW